MLTVGASSTRHALVRASSPSIAPTRSTRTGFHVAPSAEPHGTHAEVPAATAGNRRTARAVRTVGDADLRDPEALDRDRRPHVGSRR